jgi:serine/threonine protein kinase
MLAEAHRAALSEAASRPVRIPSTRLRRGAKLGEGRYRLDRRLHEGRMTAVWAARTSDGQRVAVKMLRRQWLSNPAARAWLSREHAWLAALRHPHVLQPFELIDAPGAIGVVTEYLGGGDMVSLAGADPQVWLPLARDLVATLGHLHDNGLVHRDVKARNVMLDGAQRIRLIDFGSAAVIGTPASERGTTADHRLASARFATPAEDVHAVAVLLHELCHGCLPAAAPDRDRDRNVDTVLKPLSELVSATLHSGPNGGARRMPELLSTIESALAKQPSNRTRST